MTRALAPLAALVALVAAAPAGGQEEARATLRRIALIAGANDGGAGRTPLRYAVSDAEAMAKVLRQMGGVAANDLVLLRDPSADSLKRSLAELRGAVGAARAAAPRIELVFYYSGHSDEEGLLLQGARVGYADLRRWLDATSADVRIAILDSCASGALTREKGGRWRAPFLADASSRVKGHAFLTSSSADETAQESDRVGGSFFTHYLVSGLRGAADVTHDGRVTLDEAYQFAFHETLARTEKTRGGPQHAGYDIELVGSGDLVMTDLRGTSAGLVLGKDVAGRLFVRDAAGALVAELQKYPGSAVELGLDPGKYLVTLAVQGQVLEADATVEAGKRTELSLARLAPAQTEAALQRGGGPGEPDPTPIPVVTPTRIAPVKICFVTPWFMNSLRQIPGVFDGQPSTIVLAKGEGETMNHLALGFACASGRLTGLGLSLYIQIVAEDVRGAQIAVGGNIAFGNVKGLQLAALGNSTGAVSGVQLAGIIKDLGFGPRWVFKDGGTTVRGWPGFFGGMGLHWNADGS